MPGIGRQSVLNTAAIAILPLLVASLLGQWATYPNIAGWYAGLGKPAFNPPNWIFAPVWTTLYILMAWAVRRTLPFGTDGRKTALAFFFTQLAMNAGWSWLFFGLHSPVGGLLNIVPQLVVILLTIVHFCGWIGLRPFVSCRLPVG